MDLVNEERIIGLLQASLDSSDFATEIHQEVEAAGAALREHPEYEEFAIEVSGRFAQRAVSTLPPQIISVETMGAAYLAGLNLGLAIAATGDLDWRV